MARSFSPSDRVRVEALFARHVTAPYSATVTIDQGGAVLSVTVMDPHHPDMVLASIRFDYQPERPRPGSANAVQPRPVEAVRAAVEFAALCASHAAAQG